VADPTIASDSGADRRSIEARLEGLVTRNRFTIAVVFPAVGAVLLLASAEGVVPEPLRFNPLLVLLGVAVMRLPLVAGILPLVDRRGAVGIGALVGYAYGIELVGIATGFPYGAFSYDIPLGPMLGGIPLGLPVFFLPLVGNAYLLCLLLLGDRAERTAVRLSAVAAAVVATDLVLDPAAVSLGFWSYAAGGAYYGVPLSNYAGWVLSAAIAVVLVDLAFDRAALRARLEACPFLLDDLVSFVLLWGVINAYFGNWLAVAVAAAFGGGLLRARRFDFAVRTPAGTGRA
jgi:putative membrane protein